ncbi:MAG: pyridoxamine 5'-phosphate oxidase family protein, partial [Bdellovibrionota bacterium]|nr:pyridoxamine 5'-phosphate oxidase family protein [Bdellovibrionota bacterium]
MTFEDFISIFKINLKKRGGKRNAVLSTFGIDYPKSRHVVLRSFKENRIYIYTHSLSSKVEELSKNSKCNLCWYSDRHRIQLTFYGEGKMLGSDVSEKNQKEVTDLRDYEGIKPGSDFILENTKEIHFAVIEFNINQLIALKLDSSQHEKY